MRTPVKYGVALSTLLLVSVAVACGQPNDSPSDAGHNALGPGMRLRDVQNPANKLSGQNVNVTSVVVTAVDSFDETHNGKSRGTIFVQDADLTGPLAGISLYAPTFIPANLRLAPGDVIDMSGGYSEQHSIGSTVNFGTAFLPQMNKPQVQQRFETQLPAPFVIKMSDLIDSSGNGNFTTSRQWLGMLVQIQDVTVTAAPSGDGTGRVTAPFTLGVNAPALNNELFDLQAWNTTTPNPSNSFPAGTHFKSITGILDFFFNVYICPRSMDDLVQ